MYPPHTHPPPTPLSGTINLSQSKTSKEREGATEGSAGTVVALKSCHFLCAPVRVCVRVRTGERERNRIIRALHGAQFWRRAQSVDVQRGALSVNTDIRGQNSKKGGSPFVHVAGIRDTVLFLWMSDPLSV